MNGGDDGLMVCVIWTTFDAVADAAVVSDDDGGGVGGGGSSQGLLIGEQWR